ncbi:class I SAM-dependent methyltransferase [Marinivivus vitaminiproducens]|uniref:class I SAM-dependent methyltransferase n=1 Tax=Marinivivus vitaminiproducens TaxID=3035935 RepID=UPI0027A145E9|nr:class I SAM-dependent methyltransferase [Geminicoccaceae bacterium SCSIO 64248]
MSDRTRRFRRLRLGLSTLLGGGAQGFFIPYRYAAEVRAVDYAPLLPRFREREAALRQVITYIFAHRAAFPSMAGPPPQPRFTQDWFPRLDAAALYALVRFHRPRLVVEIGSGHSTRFLARAVADGDMATRIVCIDPAPRADLAGLPIRWQRSTLQMAPPDLLDEFGPGDILFVDSSHVSQPGSDVDVLIGHVLPRLPIGALVHFHDVFLPDAYPEEWAWRGYNEQTALAALIQGGGFEIVFASHFVATRRPGWLTDAGLDTLPLLPGAHECSLWLRKRQ